MGMSLYMASAPTDAVATLARNPDSLLALTMQKGAWGAADLADDLDDDLNDVFPELDVEAQLKEARRAAWRQGLIPWLMTQMLQGEIRRSLRNARTMLPSIRAAGEGLRDAPAVLDLHKSWHILHYLFTGTAWEGGAPANTLLNGGRAIGEDLGYGPARVVDPAGTAAFAAFLATLTADALRSRLNLEKMVQLQIYCVDEGFDDLDLEELFEMVEHYLPQLQGYVGAAAERKEGLAIWMA